MNENWEYRRIGDICTVERGGSPRPIDSFITDSDDGINWIKIGDADDTMYITKTAQKIKPEGIKKSRYVRPGDFLLSNSMSFGKPYILKISGCIHDGWLVLRDEECLFDKRFLYFYLSSPSTYNQFKTMAVGGVVNNLNSEMVRNVEIPIPNMEEQLEIVKILEKLQSLIVARKQQLSDFDTLIKARFVEMFGDPEMNPKGWQEVRLLELLDVVGGYAFKSDLFLEKGIPVLRIGNINAGFFQPVNMVYWEEDEKLDRYKMFPGDLVMSLTGTVGKEDYGNVCILGNDYDSYYLNQRNAKLEIRKNLDKYYLSELLKFSAIKKRLTGISRGVRQANISNKDILNLQVPIPGIKEQEQFAAFVNQSDKSKLAVQQSLEKTQELFDSLMQKYFG